MKKAAGNTYFTLALLAFASLGLEVILAFAIEQNVYGTAMRHWTDLQNIIHWVVTCVLWGIASWYLVKTAKAKCNFDLLQKGNKIAPWQWLLIVVLVLGSLAISYFDWNGSKVIKEFYANGPVKFVFQYIYYCFETALVMLMVVFGQNAFEKWLHKPNIPYGGILVSMTWGIAHCFTQDITTGIVSMISGLAFGSVYLFTNRDLRKAYPIVWIMFVL